MSAAAATPRRLLRAAALEGEAAAREGEVLLGYVLGCDRAWLFAHADDAVTDADAERFASLLRRRAAGEPLAYITGRREFWSLDLDITPEVLIPRHETELLVEQALARIPARASASVADLGTGSGAIALAIASARPHARVLATDASAAALAVARRNAARLGVGNVEFALGDWCAALASRQLDVIVSNPPYIAADDVHLAQGDLRYEPGAALVSGPEGLDAIRRIVASAPAHLQRGGWLLLEHGHEQGAAVRALLQQSGFVEVSTVFDLEGRERVSGGRTTA